MRFPLRFGVLVGSGSPRRSCRGRNRLVRVLAGALLAAGATLVPESCAVFQTLGLAVPDSPTGLSIGNATLSTLDLSWESSIGAKSYSISIATSSSGPWKDILTTTTTNVQATGLLSGTQYWFHLTAANDAGDSASSAAASASTITPSYFGHYTAYSATTTESANYLVGQQVAITRNASLVGFGMIGELQAGHTPANGKMALYTDSSGAPDALVSESNAAPIIDGRVEFSVSAPQSVSAGTYWVFLLVDNDISIYEDESTNSTEEYTPQSFGSALPSTYVPGTTAPNTVYFNMYVIAQ